MTSQCFPLNVSEARHLNVWVLGMPPTLGMIPVGLFLLGLDGTVVGGMGLEPCCLSPAFTHLCAGSSLSPVKWETVEQDTCVIGRLCRELESLYVKLCACCVTGAMSMVLACRSFLYIEESLFVIGCEYFL